MKAIRKIGEISIHMRLEEALTLKHALGLLTEEDVMDFIAEKHSLTKMNEAQLELIKELRELLDTFFQ